MTKTCPECKGLGYIVKWVMIGDEPERDFFDCERCNGKGKIEDQK